MSTKKNNDKQSKGAPVLIESTALLAYIEDYKNHLAKTWAQRALACDMSETEIAGLAEVCRFLEDDMPSGIRKKFNC